MEEKKKVNKSSHKRTHRTWSRLTDCDSLIQLIHFPESNSETSHILTTIEFLGSDSCSSVCLLCIDPPDRERFRVASKKTALNSAIWLVPNFLVYSITVFVWVRFPSSAPVLLSFMAYYTFHLHPAFLCIEIAVCLETVPLLLSRVDQGLICPVSLFNLIFRLSARFLITSFGSRLNLLNKSSCIFTPSDFIKDFKLVDIYSKTSYMLLKKTRCYVSISISDESPVVYFLHKLRCRA